MEKKLVSFSVANLFVVNCLLLDKVERHLTECGHLDLSGALNQLQIDAGIYVFEGIGDGRGADEVVNTELPKTREFFETPNPETNSAGDAIPPFDPENLVETRRIHNVLRPLTHERCNVLDTIGGVLSTNAPSLAADFNAHMLVPYKQLTADVPVTTRLPSPPSP